MRINLTFVLSISFIVFSLKCHSKSDKFISEISRQKSALYDTISGKKSSQDITTHKYDNYDITITPNNEDLGESITVFNKKNKSTFIVDKGASYFFSVIDSFMIVDIGTASYRELEIYNLDNNKVVFSTGYDGNLKIDKKLILFNTAVEIVDDSMKPKCPQQDNFEYNGFIEKQIYDLASLQLIKTGKFECAFFE